MKPSVLFDLLSKFPKSIILITIVFHLSTFSQVNTPDASKANKLFGEAQGLYERGIDNKSALEKFRRAAALFASDGDRNSQAASLVFCGMLEERLDEPALALKTYGLSLAIAREVDDKFVEGIALAKIGALYANSGEYRKGVEYCEQALPLLRGDGNKQLKAYTQWYLAAAYQALGDKKKAYENYSAAIPLLREIGDKHREALAWNSVGLIELEQNVEQQAVVAFSRALTLFRETGDKTQEGVSTFNLAGVSEKSRDFRKAITLFEQALTRFREIGDKAKEAAALASIGYDHSQLGDLERAVDYYTQALAIDRKIENKAGEARTLNNLGLAYDAAGQKPKALENFKGALLVYEALDDRYGQATVSANIGHSLSSAGDNVRALEYYTKSLLISRAIRDHSSEAQALANLGLIYQIRGETERMEELYAESLALCRSSGDKDGEAALLTALGFFFHSARNFAKARDSFGSAARLCGESNPMCASSTQIGLGAVHKEQAEYQRAIESYNVAISLARSAKFREGEILGLNTLGQVYLYLGLNQQALDSFDQALRVSESIGRKDSEALSLGNVAQAYFAMEDYQKSLDHSKRALSIVRLTGNKNLEMYFLNNSGLALVEMKRPSESLAYFENALNISRSQRNRQGEALNLLNLGYANSEMKDYIRAMPFLRQALYISAMIEDPNTETLVLGTIAKSLYDQGKLALAAVYGKQALNGVQSERKNLQGFDLETQRAFIKKWDKGYRELANLFIELGRIAEAERVLDMLKEEELFDYLRRDDAVSDSFTAKMSLDPAEKRAIEEYNKHRDHLTFLGKELGELQVESKRYEPGKFPNQKRLDELERLIANANKVFNAFLDDLKAQFGESDRRTAKVENLSGSQAFLKELGQPGTVMISTIVGEDKLNLIVTTADAQRAHVVNIKAAELNKLVARFRSDARNPRTDSHTAGKALHDKLFPASLQKDLEGVKADTLVWSLDGTLRYVPIAALWDGKQYLVEKYKNVLITLATRDRLGLAPVERSKWQVLGAGVSKEATLKESDGTPKTFEALTSVPEELCGVVADPEQQCGSFENAKNGLLTGKSLLDDRFTLSNFKNNLGRFPVVHIASHFSLNPGNENDSYLLLGGGDQRRFTLADVRQGGAKFLGVELLTLSACNTAMSTGNRSNGVEVEGFGALAQNQGAKSVVASLWPVADVSTRDLMIEFYKQLEATPRVSKAEALQRAQLSLMKGKYAHPYYWSPFILMGNWQ